MVGGELKPLKKIALWGQFPSTLQGLIANVSYGKLSRPTSTFCSSSHCLAPHSLSEGGPSHCRWNKGAASFHHLSL